MDKSQIPQQITGDFLLNHPEVVFVFGDNLLRKGCMGGAALRDFPNAYGFITKKFPNRDGMSSFYPEAYVKVYETEIIKLKCVIRSLPHCTFVISPIGSGLANMYGIWEKVIRPRIKQDLSEFEDRIHWLF